MQHMKHGCMARGGRGAEPTPGLLSGVGVLRMAVVGVHWQRQRYHPPSNGGDVCFPSRDHYVTLAAGFEVKE
jgi:hypothetical protein